MVSEALRGEAGVDAARDDLDAAFAEVERAWRLAGASEKLMLHFHEAGHRVDSAAALACLQEHVRD